MLGSLGRVVQQPDAVACLGLVFHHCCVQAGGQTLCDAVERKRSKSVHRRGLRIARCGVSNRAAVDLNTELC